MQEVRIPPLVEVLTEISDWRKARGKRYRLVSLLGLLILGLLCGKYRLRSISRWGKGLPDRTRQRLALPEKHSPSPARAAIENGTHWVRDVVMGEDDSRIHKGTAPQAALRNLAINLARIAGFDSITAAADAFAADPTKALSLMGF